MTLRSVLTLAAPLALAACSGDHHPAPPAPVPSPAPAPFYVDGGVGSEHGNFVSHEAGETTGPGGVRCVIYVWDRPLTAQTALRLRSQSCEHPPHSGLYIATELERAIIPIASSTLIQGD